MRAMGALVGLVSRAPARLEVKLLTAFLASAVLLIVMGVVSLQVLRGVNQRNDELIKLQRKVEAYRQVQHDITGQLYGVSSALQAMLLSPKFLFRVEANPGAGKVAALSDYELASRLSYFLWSSMPDDQLLARAAAGALHAPDELARRQPPQQGHVAAIHRQHMVEAGDVGGRDRACPQAGDIITATRRGLDGEP